MQFFTSYTTAFDAGHRYTVRVEWEREGWGDQSAEDFARARALIEALVFELNNRDLAKQLGPHHPSVFGIAAFFMERLSINLTVKRVEVHESGSDTNAIIESSAEF